MRGRLIAFEGGEAVGKSTQAALLADRLGAVLTREPGGTPLGGALRRMLLDGGDLSAKAETLMMLADRAQHVEEVIGPALAAGRLVVTDRFSHSTLAYQGAGRGMDQADLRRMCSWATGGIWPDLVILLRVPPEVASARLGPSRDRLEREDEGFHRRVAEAFDAMAVEDPAGWMVVDGSGDVAQVAAAVGSGWDRWAERAGVGRSGTGGGLGPGFSFA